MSRGEEGGGGGRGSSRECGLSRGDGGGVSGGVVDGPPPEEHPLETVLGRQAGLQGVEDDLKHGNPGSFIRRAVPHADLYKTTSASVLAPAPPPISTEINVWSYVEVSLQHH
jgi:hypothetical protein